MNVFKSLIGALIGAAVATGIYYVIKQSTGETYVWFPMVTGVLTGLVARSLTDSSTSNAASYVCGALAGLIAGGAIFSVEFVPALLAKGPERGPVVVKRIDTKPMSTGDADSKEATPADADDSEENRSDDADSEKALNPADGNDGAADEAKQEPAGSDPDASETTDQNKEYVDPNQAMMDRSRNRPEQSPIAPPRREGIAPPKQKSAFQKWLDEYLPFIFSGVGVLLAYQLARGFGSAAPKLVESAPGN